MSRSGYCDDYDESGRLALYRQAVERSIKGARGQAMLRELAEAMDAMPIKRLIAEELEHRGEFCTLGVLGAKRGIDMAGVDPEDTRKVAKMFGIAESMAREIVFLNDEWESWNCYSIREGETPEKRWTRMRRWVAEQLNSTPGVNQSEKGQP